MDATTHATGGMMDSRSQFEAWFNSEMYLSLEEFEKSNPAVVSLIFGAWQAWPEECRKEVSEKIRRNLKGRSE